MIAEKLTLIFWFPPNLFQISNSIANVLYFLAKNPEKQEKVYEEVSKLLPNKDDELPNNFDGSLRYLKACIKETQR